MEQINDVYAWIGPDNGKATLYWHANGPEYYDWVGLYADQSKGVNEYITWQWVSKGSGYVTSQIIQDGLSVRYNRWAAMEASDAPDLKIVSLDDVDDAGERLITPTSLLATLSGSYIELMRTSDLELEVVVNAMGEYALTPGCWVSCTTSGYAELHWTAAKSQKSNDWVGLYSDTSKSNADYLTYQWAPGHSSYITSYSFVPGIQARYITEIGGKYIALRRSKPIAKGYYDLFSMYQLTSQPTKDTTPDVQKIVRILTDQLAKAYYGQDSVFSVGGWPFHGNNLLFKNLSYEEVKVIGAELYPSQYYDVIMTYYDTYIMAIQIADDGERNAKRHAFWQISMVRKFGEDFAKKIGDAHERGRPGTAEDNRVDAINNAAALTYAKAHPAMDPETAANTMWNEGLIIGYQDSVAPEHTKDEL